MRFFKNNSGCVKTKYFPQRLFRSNIDQSEAFVLTCLGLGQIGMLLF